MYRKLVGLKAEYTAISVLSLWLFYHNQSPHITVYNNRFVCTPRSGWCIFGVHHSKMLACGQGIMNSTSDVYWAQFIKIEILGFFNSGFIAYGPLKGTVIWKCPELLCWRVSSQS